MKNILKFSALAAALVASATFASADSFTFISNSGTVSYVGYSSTISAPAALSSITGINTAGAGAATNIGYASPWSMPIGTSQWVSQAAGTEPGGSLANAGTISNGDYIYQTVLTGAVGGAYTGSISLLADDTVAVYLNGVLIVPAAGGPNSTCQTAAPNCTESDYVPLSVVLAAGNNDLTFVVEQTNLSAEGLDFSGSLSEVPEPNTLMLLGTGLIGSAGALFRRARS
jgi:PEP-CTERM motif